MEVNLLNLRQIVGVDARIFKIYDNGIIASITDYASILGGYSCNIKTNTNSNTRVGTYWLKMIRDDEPFIVDIDGDRYTETPLSREVGIRPVLTFSEVHTNYRYDIIKKINDNIMEIDFGYYPKNLVSKEMRNELENALKTKEIIKTGNIYTIDSTKVNENWKQFEPLSYEEYEYKSAKYVRALVNSCYTKFNKTTNGDKYRYGDIVWVEVKPITGLVDINANIMVTKQIIMAGIQFHDVDILDSFKETNIYKYLNTYFIKEIIQNISKEIELKVEYEKSKQEIELENIEKAKQKILELKKKY